MPSKKRKHRESFGQIDTLPSGRYRARYTGPDGKLYAAPTTFDNMTDARTWLAGQRVELAKGTWSAAEAEQSATAKATRADTLADYAATWIAERVNRHGEALRPRTRVEYERLLSGPLADLATERLAAITPAKVRTWRTAQADTGKATQTARAYGLLNSVLTTAVQDGRIKSNPCIIRGAQNATTGRKVIPPKPAELDVILGTITPRYRAAVIIAAWAATRFGELTELRRKDIHVGMVDGAVAAIVVEVTRGVTHTTGVGYVIGKTKSEAGERSIMLPPHVNGIVVDHLAEYVGDSPEALLFPARGGVKHLAESTFVKHWYPARAAAGRSDMPFHALRHHGLTKFAQTGATLKEIQERAGHSTVAAAMRYQHSAGRDAELAMRMSELASA